VLWLRLRAIVPAAAEARQPGSWLEGQECREQTLRRENERLKQLVAEQRLEVDFFKGALQKIEARRHAEEGRGGRASSRKSTR
jgi:hypothetical protein